MSKARDVVLADAPPGRPGRSHDFALVIGIDHYPRFRSLHGAIGDATAFHAWTCDPEGGGVDPAHARLIVSTPDPAAPVQDQVDDALVELLEAADGLGGGRRLYFYFSGHGAMSPDISGDDVALLLAKWSASLARLALSSRGYAGKLCTSGVFQELAIFLDCCRSTAVRAVGLPPTITYEATSPRSPTRTFLAYATEAGHAAFERPQNGTWRGVFTRCLLAILGRSPHGIDARALKDRLECEVAEASAGQQAHVSNGLLDGARFGVPRIETPPRIGTPSVEHDHEPRRRPIDSPLETPAPLAGAAASHEYYIEPAVRLGLVDTAPPIGPAPHDGRLFIFLRREARDRGPPSVPSEPVTIHDLTGRKLAALCRDTARMDDELGYVAYACAVASGTYRLRAGRARRDVAITIPAARAAHVFLADDGAVRLEDLRVALRPVGTRFEPASEVARAMESAIAALRVPDGQLPAAARALLPAAIDDDLCFGIASAHLLWRSRDLVALRGVVAALTERVGVLPDVSILAHLVRWEQHRGASTLELSTPPLLRASLVAAMTLGEPAGIAIDPGRAIGQATRADLHDSIWCTWSERAWDARWIAPTIAELRTRGSGDAASIAQTLALPIETVHRTIEEFDATLPSIRGAPARPDDLRVPGYALGKVLGCGSQGTVFRAKRERDGRAVALKVVPLTGGAEQRRRVARELALVQRIEHPRIVGCSAAGALGDDIGVWLELELCRGSVLDLVAEADAPMAPARACALVLQALEGLAHLHAAGIVHRDVKPSNLLVRDDGSAALSDLGIAKHLDHAHLTATGRAGGTAHFAPREQLLDFKRTPPASDVWSMAATLYFLLTLDLPRDAYTDQSELEAALENPIVPILERRPELPPALARCLDRALSDDLAGRPGDAAAFRAELAAARWAHASLNLR
jgi:hypothetical protein